MIRSAFALLSTLQIGARIKDSVERSLRQAMLIGLAVAVLVVAAMFGLLAAYQSLVLVFQFSPTEAAGIAAMALLLVGLLILAALPAFGGSRKHSKPVRVIEAGEGLGFVDQSLGKVMQQVGPITLIAVAFVAGLLASRR